MTEIRQLPPAFSRPGFWANCFLDEYADDLPGRHAAADDDDDDAVIEFDLGDGCALLAGTGLCYASLESAHPGSTESAELGWDDLAHWHPHALRWSETDLVCRAVALDDPDAAYPGPRLALLGRFTPVCDEADAALAVPLLRLRVGASVRRAGLTPARSPSSARWPRPARCRTR